MTTYSPQAGPNTTVTTGGTPVQAIPANVAGGYITNPVSNTDQGITTAEVLIADPVSATPGSGAGAGNGTATALYPGQTFEVIPFSAAPVYVNAVTNGHKFTAVYWS